jgi:hypothetical protein
VVYVVPIGVKDGPAAENAADHGQRRIEQGNGECQDRGDGAARVALSFDHTIAQQPRRKPIVRLPQSPRKMDAR